MHNPAIDSPFTFLVQYGRCGFVGRFASHGQYMRGDGVVIHGPRGLEPGEVLLKLDGLGDDGVILRRATDEDRNATRIAEVRGQQILNTACESAASTGLPITFVDIEVTLNSFAILHALPWGACDATPLLEELSAKFGLDVRLLDLSQQPTAVDASDPPQASCGKPGCGSSGGGCSSCGTDSSNKSGCSTGSCSRGAVKTPAELTAYFIELRKKMEAAGLTRTPLH